MNTIDTVTVEDFIGVKATYDNNGTMIWGNPEGGMLQRLLDLRGWGAIQNLFIKKDKGIDFDAAAKFQDELGEWIADAINQKLQSLQPSPSQGQSSAKKVVEDLIEQYEYFAQRFLPVCQITKENYPTLFRAKEWLSESPASNGQSSSINQGEQTDAVTGDALKENLLLCLETILNSQYEIIEKGFRKEVVPVNDIVNAFSEYFSVVTEPKF